MTAMLPHLQLVQLGSPASFMSKMTHHCLSVRRSCFNTQDLLYLVFKLFLPNCSESPRRISPSTTRRGGRISQNIKVLCARRRTVQILSPRGGVPFIDHPCCYCYKGCFHVYKTLPHLSSLASISLYMPSKFSSICVPDGDCVLTYFSETELCCLDYQWSQAYFDDPMEHELQRASRWRKFYCTLQHSLAEYLSFVPTGARKNDFWISSLIL